MHLLWWVAVCIGKSCVCMLSRFWLCATPWTIVCQAPLPMGFSRQEYLSGLPLAVLGDYPNMEIKPESHASPELPGKFFTTVTLGKPIHANFKKCTVWMLWVKLYWEENEDYSLGDSISDSSEKLLWGGTGKSEGESHSVVSNSLRPHGLHSPWNSPGQNTGVGSCSLLLGIFPTQGLNPGLLHCRQILYQLSHKGSPVI